MYCIVCKVFDVDNVMEAHINKHEQVKALPSKALCETGSVTF